jgi:hypothetical protein
MHPRRLGDGLIVPQLMAPAARFAVRRLNVGGRIATRDAGLTRRSPVVVVLAVPGDTVAAGQALPRMLLTAAGSRGTSGVVSEPAAAGCRLRPRVTELLAGPGAPQLVLRLGYPPRQLPATPRRPLDAVIEDATGHR